MLDGLSCGARLPSPAFEDLKRRAARDAFKWNVMENGGDALCDFPIVIDQTLWATLSRLAVRLSAEAEHAEAELLTRPLLQARLGIPWRLRRSLPRSGAGLRFARFDFHPTAKGAFAITEGNMDVAGGWNEASAIAASFAAATSNLATAGDPAQTLAACLASRLGRGKTVGLMHLTRYAEDHQVAKFLAKAFESRGLRALFFDPTQLRSAGHQAGALLGDRIEPLDAVFRFFPAEWACRLEGAGAWFRASALPGTVWLNPLSTVLTQSKRFPLTWPHLRARLPTWESLLPETRWPLFLSALPAGRWTIKPALGHEGYRVGVPGATDAEALRALWRRAKIRPWQWAAQRTFEPRAIETPDGPRFPCLGVYVIDGQAAGLYGRLSSQPLINDLSQDVVVLVRS